MEARRSEMISVLHVDDDPDFADLVATSLERENDRFTVETAMNATEGLDRLGDRPPDCIVSDYDMPGKNGIEFLRTVRERHPDLPFILYTGKGSETVASDAISAGVTDYLQKGSGTEQYKLLANRIENTVQAQRDAQTLDRQEELMRLTEVAGDTGGWELDLETDELVLTTGAQRLAGVDRGRLTFDQWLDLYHPEDTEAIRATVEQAIETQEQTEDTWRLLSNTDTHREVNVTMTPVVTDSKVTAIRGAISDITEYKRREQKLRQYRDLLESINDAVFVVDQDRTIVYANEQSLANVNLTPEKAYGEPLMPLVEEYAVDRADIEEFEQALRATLDDSEGESPAPVELTLAVNGSQSVFEFRFSRVPTDHVTPGDSDVSAAVAVVAREVTDRVRRTTELRRTRDLLAEMERIADIGAWEYDPDTGESTSTAGAQRIHGVAPETDLSLDEAFDLYHPEDGERLRTRFRECLETGDPYEIDVRLTRTDGEQRWVTARGERVQTQDRQPVVRGYIQDITDKKERLNHLEQIETLFENAQDKLFIVEHSNGEFVVERVNTAFEDATGLSNEDLQGKTPQEVFGEERGKQIEEKYRQCVETGEALSYEETVSEEKLPKKEAPTDDGLTYWETRITSVGTDGEVDWIVGATRDINERKRREQEIKRRNERLDEFTSIISHDLRSPLNVAAGKLELAREDCDSEQLEDAADAIERSQALIDDLLSLARDGDAVGNVGSVSLAELAEECWRMVPTAEATLDIETDCTVSADSGQLQQLLGNLFSNAVMHGGADVTVTIGTVTNGFYISDDGTGIPEVQRDKLFEAGYSTAEEGTGFGLPIVNQIATAHGWEVTVTESDDGGARFEITGVTTID